MGLVKNHRAKFLFQQVVTFPGVVEDEAGGDNGDAHGTVDDVFRAAGLNDVAFGVQPYFFGR